MSPLNSTYLVSDDYEPSQAWAANLGVTFPDGINATYNINLSPLSAEHAGRAGGSEQRSSYVIAERGQAGSYWSTVTTSSSAALYFISGQSNVYPSTVEWHIATLSLRCLVSTNNRIIINLVSDDDEGRFWGITLPGNEGATYDGALSPLFIQRIGAAQSRVDWIAISDRGSDGYFWEANAPWPDSAFHLWFSINYNVRPANTTKRINGWSLRCLVSTNNR